MGNDREELRGRGKWGWGRGRCRELWEVIGREELRGRGKWGWGRGRCKQRIKHVFLSTAAFKGSFVLKRSLKNNNKNGQVLNKPQIRLLLKISGGTIYIYIYPFSKTFSYSEIYR